MIVSQAGPVHLTWPVPSTNVYYAEGVMSGIISAAPFNDVFTATRDNSTMQGTVTAIYEIGGSSLNQGRS
jgi:hypothetical protein